MADDGGVQQASRFDLARALAPRYAHATWREKGQLLDEFCAVTGYTRKHALVLLRCPPAENRPPPYRGRPPSYGPAEVALLRMCWSATEQSVLAALRGVQAGLPFPLLGLDADNGSEFLNSALLEYCADQRITFTRGRPYRKNDSCFVEQKNWAVVRRLVGYARLEAPALAALERVHELARDYVNFLHPVRKLREKVRQGARITRRYDNAQTPYRRLLASGMLTPRHIAALERRSAALDPLRLKLELESAQRTLAQRAIRSVVVHPIRSDSF